MFTTSYSKDLIQCKLLLNNLAFDHPFLFLHFLISIHWLGRYNFPSNSFCSILIKTTCLQSRMFYKVYSVHNIMFVLCCSHLISLWCVWFWTAHPTHTQVAASSLLVVSFFSYQGNSDEVGCYVAPQPLSKGTCYFEVRQQQHMFLSCYAFW